MEDGAISAVYDRKDALSLTAEQMTAMGLRPFDAPAFRVGGAYRQNQDDALQVSAISCMLDSQQILEEVSFAAQRGKILAIAGPNGARQIHALPHHHRFIPGNGFGFPQW